MNLTSTLRRRAAYVALALILAPVIFAGCKSPDVATGFNKANVKTVRVDGRVSSYGMRVGLQTYGGTAGIADAIVNKMYKGELTEIQNLMDGIPLSVPELVRAEFIQQLNARGLVTIVEDNPDAVFLIQIRQHGFTEYPPFTGNDLPFLEIFARLVDKNENTLWKATSLQAKRGYPKMGGSLKDYHDPAKLKNDWETQVKAAVQSMLSPR